VTVDTQPPRASIPPLSRLNPRQVGRIGEHLARIAFTRAGFQVYVPDLDDRGVDLLVHRGDTGYLRIQVKTLRDYSYVFMRKAHFQPSPDLWALIIQLGETQDRLFLIPSERWLTPDKVFVDRDYEGLKSAPEYGINITAANLPSLAPHRFDLALPLPEEG